MAARLLTRSKTPTLNLNLNSFLRYSTTSDPIPTTQCFGTRPSLTSQQPHPRNHGSAPLSVSTSAAVEPASRTDLAAAPATGFARSLPAARLSAPLGSQKTSSCGLYQPLHAGTQTLPRWFCRATRHHAYNVLSHYHHSTENDKMGKMVGRIEEGKRGDEPDPLNAKKGDRSKVISFSPLEGSYLKGRASALAKESLKIKRTELSQKITLALIPVLLLASKTNLTTSLLITCVFWQIHGFFKDIFLDYIHHEVTREWVLVYFRLLLLILAKNLILLFGLA